MYLKSVTVLVFSLVILIRPTRVGNALELGMTDTNFDSIYHLLFLLAIPFPILNCLFIFLFCFLDNVPF